MPVADDIIKSCGESVDDKRCIFVLNDPINSMKEGRIYFDFRSCIPSGITYSQLRTVIVDYLIPYPEKGKIIPSPRERDSHAGDSQGEGNMIHRGKREGVCHGGCGSSSQGLRGRANTRAGEAV